MEVIARADLILRLGSEERIVLVDVLKPDEYAESHIRGAVNVPFDENFEENIRRTVSDEDTPVVLYCSTSECDASAQAAQRLDELGYRHVYDFTAGKQDWKRAGLPMESGRHESPTGK